MEEIVKKIILFFVLSFAVSDVFAEVDPKLLGRWVSEPMYEGTEKLIVEYEFEDAYETCVI